MAGLFQVRMAGLSGPVQLEEGRRSAVRLQLLKLTEAGMRPVGEWTRQRGVTITNRTAFFGAGRPNVTLLVTTIVVSDITELTGHLSIIRVYQCVSSDRPRGRTGRRKAALADSHFLLDINH